MKYIKEYKIFDFIKKRNSNSFEFFTAPLKYDLVEKETQKIYHISKDKMYDFNSLKKEYFIKNAKNNFITFWQYKISSGYTDVNYKYIKLLDNDLESKLEKNNIFIGNLVYLKREKINGIIKAIDDCFISKYSSFSISSFYNEKDGFITKLITIDTKEGEKYSYANDIVVIKEVDKIKLQKSIKEIIEDYLLEMSEDNRFLIKIDNSSENDLSYLIDLEIVKDQNNLEVISNFFKKISILRERLLLNENCDLEIEEISKSKIKIKVFRSIIKENTNEFCNECGEELINGICYNCADINIDTKVDKEQLPSFGVETTKSQNLYYL